ncbi:hypothetical protein CB1_002313016, partial [Camelus ferus]
MKPALLEVMRMNRICRMVLATCLGSFILVIFYFQSVTYTVRYFPKNSTNEYDHLVMLCIRQYANGCTWMVFTMT